MRVTDEMVTAAVRAAGEDPDLPETRRRHLRCLRAAIDAGENRLGVIDMAGLPFENQHLEARLHKIEQAIRALAAMDEDWKAKTLTVTSILRPDQEGDPE
jgi:hypothetical protein